MVASNRPPSSTTAGTRAPTTTTVVGGYEGGGGLTRKITSHDIAPIESLVAQRGRDEPLREEEHDTDLGLERGRTDTQETHVEDRDPAATTRTNEHEDQDPTSKGKLEKSGVDRLVFDQEGGGVAPEWTFPDGGWRAWSVILGCFLHSCNCQGYGMVWGVLVTSLKQDHFPNTSLATLNLIIGLQNLGQNASPFLTGRLGEKFGFKRMIAIGSCLSVSLLVLSAVAVESLPALFVVQGILLGVAHGISLPLFMTIPSQWFSRRRGLATGITVSGTGFGGGFGSLIIRGILPKLGYRNSLFVYAGISASTYIVGWFLLKTRRPPIRKVPQSFGTKTGLPPGIWKDGAFYSILACVFFGVFGFLTPSYYLTAYTTQECPELDPNSLAPSVPLIVSNFTLGIGRVFSGLLADLFGPVNCLFFSFCAGGILQLAFWSNARRYGSIIAFGALYQLLGGWFFALLPYASAQLFGTRGLATITGFIIAGQSPGQFAGASLSGVVLDGAGSYRAVAYYAGSLMLFGSLCILPARFLREKRIFARL